MLAALWSMIIMIDVEQDPLRLLVFQIKKVMTLQVSIWMMSKGDDRTHLKSYGKEQGSLGKIQSFRAGPH